MTRKEETPASTVFDKGFLPIERRLLHLSAGDQRGFLLLRLLLAATLFAQTFTPGAYFPPGSAGFWWIAGTVAIYTAAAGTIFRLRTKGKISDALNLGFFMLDIVVSLLVFYFAGGSESDIFIALLLLILASCLLQKPILIFSVTLAACLAYGLMVFPDLDRFANVFLLRLCLFLLITLFGIHIADYAGWIERETAKRYEERLAWMQRLSMVGRAMAAVLHEAKTPLGTVVLNADSAIDLIRDKKDPSAELRIIAEEADHAATILQNFLDFVKPTQLELKPLLVHEPLLQAVEMVKIRLDERCVALNVRTLNDCKVLGSSRHLLQVFTNILHNAADAMPTGGTITVDMEKQREKVAIHVQDTGAGMSPEELDQLFEPFTTSKAGEEGHGLGLSIVRWILTEHGGDIRVQSQGLGTGTRVTLVMPLNQKFR